MARLVAALVAATLLGALSGVFAPARAGIVVTVDKSAQRLSVSVDGRHRYEWPVSTARIGYRTPVGTYRPERLARQWFSRKYDWSPMPYSIFFNGGYAIHGSYEVSRLGTPASHGCIRLSPQHAAILFALVREHEGDTRIVVTGESDAPQMSERRVSEHRIKQRREVRRYKAKRFESPRVVERFVESRRSRKNFEEVFVDTPDDELPVGDFRRRRSRY
jgi:L,D-transpeptidase-like protein